MLGFVGSLIERPSLSGTMTSEIPTIPPRNRVLLGGMIFVIGFAAPVLIPVVAISNLPTVWKTFLSGFLALGIPEIFMLIAAGILGKQGFAYLKSKLWRMIQPPETVGLVRYRIGLLMLFVPILFIWLHPYLEQARPNLADQRMLFGLISDGLVIVSLFVLGGEFWDKLRGLFIYNAQVIQPSETLDTTTDKTESGAVVPPMARLLLGGSLFGLSLLLPVFIPLLAYLPVSDEVRLVLSGLMVFGIPQLFMLVTVSILGKPGFVYLKKKLARFFTGLLVRQVSQRRYRAGLFLFVIPVVVGFIWPYLNILFARLYIYKYEIAIAGDVMLITAVFALGGGFWEKLVSLFIHQSRVVPASK